MTNSVPELVAVNNREYTIVQSGLQPSAKFASVAWDRQICYLVRRRWQIIHPAARFTNIQNARDRGKSACFKNSGRWGPKGQRPLRLGNRVVNNTHDAKRT